jgi:hypothetical protein
MQERVEDVDNIKDDDIKLVQTVKRLASISVNEEVVLDESWKTGENFQSPDTSVCAVLIKKDSAAGAVRVYSDPVTNVVTGPSQEAKVVLIVLRNDETCRLFGRPSVRWFSRH